MYLGLQHAWVSVAISHLDAGFHEHRFAHLLACVGSVFNLEQAQCSIMMDIGTHTNYQFSRWQGPLSFCL